MFELTPIQIEQRQKKIAETRAKRLADAERLASDQQRFEKDGSFTKDPVIRKISFAALGILIISWAVSFVAFAIPYWRGDQWNHGGLFQICGTGDVILDPTIGGGAGGWVINNTHPLQCKSLNEYCDRILKVTEPLLKIENGYYSHFHNDAARACTEIHAGLYLEVLRISLSIFAGIGTFYFICFPTPDPKRASTTGVGYFDKSSQAYMGVSSQLVVATMTVDVFVQYLYLRWGTFRNGWHIVGVNTISSMGPRISVTAL
ncbi:hypothetical protein HDU76_001107 [Blyttiomyces sp. JEL0837]|nr:hypothetical protein HDU76_001107 [Blyttiomyces sp. JEL0837]